MFDKHGWKPAENLKGSNKHTEYREEFTEMNLDKKLADVQGGRSDRPFKKRKRARSADSSEKPNEQTNGFNLPTYKGKPAKLAIHRFSSDSGSNSSVETPRIAAEVRK